MKNSWKLLIRAGLILLTAILLSNGIVWLIDIKFNGAFLNWFENVCTSWGIFKQTVIYVFFIFILLLTLCSSLSAYFFNRYRSKKDSSVISEAILSVMESGIGNVKLPKKYSEIEMQIIKLQTLILNQKQLADTEIQRKNELITYLAHDLKTPLASVVGYLSLLDEAQDMPVEQKAKYTGIALRKAYRLEELINEFFEITRFNLQTIVINKSRINLTLLLKQMADEFYPIMAPQGKQVTIQAPEELMLTGDADKLARVFNNIFKNAIAYSYDNSEIEISAAQQGEKVIITFKNEGDPIPPQKLDTIFEKFFRLDSSRSTNTGGAGLGLAIAREIVVAHGGTISVQSTSDCTNFIVTLPLEINKKILIDS